MKYASLITGYMPVAVFLAALTFSALGWFIYKAVVLAGRDRGKSGRPGVFSIKFWILDNWQEGLKHLLILFVFVRFAPDLVSGMVELGMLPASWINFFKSADNMFIYLFIGGVAAWWIERGKKKKFKK